MKAAEKRSTMHEPILSGVGVSERGFRQRRYILSGTIRKEKVHMVKTIRNYPEMARSTKTHPYGLESAATTPHPPNEG